MGLEVTFLGTGTSQGVPVIACDCAVCTSVDPRDNRLRTSVYIRSGETSIVIDTGPDFRQQMLRESINILDAVVFTHEHKDHVAGMDDIRAFNFAQKNAMEVYCTERVAEALKREFHYVFTDDGYPGVPKVNLNIIDSTEFSIKDVQLQPIRVMHYKMPVQGFRIGGFTYITDAKYIPDRELEKIKGSEVLVLNALRKQEHVAHFTLDEAVELAQSLDVKRTYFTHISHYLGKHEDVSRELPEGIDLAYDGLKVTIDN